MEKKSVNLKSLWERAGKRHKKLSTSTPELKPIESHVQDQIESPSNENQVESPSNELQLVVHVPEIGASTEPEIGSGSPLSPITEDIEDEEAIYDIDLLVHDPGKRIPITGYDVNEQDAVRRGSIEESFASNSKQLRVLYKSRLTYSLKCLRFILRQGLACRGHDEGEDSQNKGNFLELLNWLAENFEEVNKVVLKNAPKTSQMTSHKIQKDLINSCAKETTRLVIDDLGDDYFAILADKSSDVYQQEQLALCLRYVDKQGRVVERFLGIVHVENTTALTLKTAIESLLMDHSLSLTRVRGQGYDGASNMKGQVNGLKKLIMDESPSAYYIHCFAHQLQLTLVAVAKENGDCVWFFQQLAYLLNVLGMSCKKIQMLRVAQAQRIVEALELGDIETGQGLNQEMGLGRPADTCWGSHYKTVMHVISLYPSIRRVLIKIGEDHTSSTEAIQAQTMLTSFESFEFVFLAHLMLTIFGYTADLSNALQKRDQDIVNAIDLIYLTKTQLQLLREDDGWETFLNDVTSFCVKHSIKVAKMDAFYKPVARSKRFFKKVKNLHRFHVEMFLSVIDGQLRELNDRFDEVNTDLLLCMSSFNPADSFAAYDKENLVRLAQFYPKDFSSTELMHLSFQLTHFITDMRRDERFRKVKNLAELSIVLVQSKKNLHYKIAPAPRPPLPRQRTAQNPSSGVPASPRPWPPARRRRRRRRRCSSSSQPPSVLEVAPAAAMDLPSLAVVLRAALSHAPEERKAAEASLNQFQYTPQHLVRLLQIIVDGNCDMAVRQVASIHFKNFVSKNWSPTDPEEKHTIPENDKSMVRENILGFVTQLPPLLRAQLGESIKTLILADYPEQWPSLLHWVTHNLESQDQIFGALYVLRILARKYEFKSEEERIPLYQIVEDCFPRLLNIFSTLVQIVNPPIEVADLIKLICKIFWSSIYLEIPKQLFDPNVFNAWMVLFLNLLEMPVPMEGQPLDPDARKAWAWWKVKKWIIHILNRLYTRFADLKVQKPESKAFAQMFQKNYAGKILGCHLQLLNAIRTGGYLPDRVVNLILQYLTNSVTKNSMYQLMQPQIDIILFEIIFPLMCFNDNDQMLWDEDPHEYVRKGYDIIEDLYSPRTAAMDFVSELVRKRGKGNLQKFIHFIVEIFMRYDEASIEAKPYRQKDGALLAIGTLCDRLKQTDPYKGELERMLVQHVFPEFNSHVGHLRAKAAWVAGQYAHINFSDQDNFRKAMHCVISGLRDPELPVRVDSVFALRSFVEACKDLDEIRPILPQLLDEFFKLMSEVENEDLVFTLETIVDKFGEEMAPYALGLCQSLAAAFWRCIASSEADDEVEDTGALAAVGCLRAISTILESISSLPHLFIQIEPTLLPILRRMLTSDGQDVYEEVLEIVSYMTFYSPAISLDMWSLWPLMMEALNDWAIDFFENILVPFDNYISRGTDHFVACNDPDYQQSLWKALSSIMTDQNMEDSDIVPAPKLIEVVFQNCKGQVDHWVEPYLRLTIDRLRRAEKPYLKCLLVQVIANALYYNPSLTLATLHKLGVATEIFNLWFVMLQQVKKSGKQVNFKREHGKKVCCLGLTSLIGLPANHIPAEALERIFKATLELLVSYKDQVAESKRENDAAADDLDGFDADEEDEGFESDKEMGVDDEDGDEVNSLNLQRLAQARGFQLHDDDDDDDDDDDFSDDEELQTPIDEVDPFIFFVETIQAIQASDPARFQNLVQTLDFHYQALASGVAQHAEERKIEIEKEKLEKANAQ